MAPASPGEPGRLCVRVTDGGSRLSTLPVARSRARPEGRRSADVAVATRGKWTPDGWNSCRWLGCPREREVRQGAGGEPCGGAGVEGAGGLPSLSQEVSSRLTVLNL